MAKGKEEPATTWAGKMKEFGGGDFTFISSDGEVLIFIIAGLPRLMESQFKGKAQERIGCPVITENGYQLLVCGKRVARKLSKFEADFETSAFMVVRHGVEGDINARYDVQKVPEKETFDALQKVKAEDFSEDMIEDSIKSALEVMQG
ncbi:MAG: hypothetical protein GY782_01135 [Gammaproteobacteria bacterium]|nr:hypothetical protein [Gammaproteobacteria bacterium]